MKESSEAKILKDFGKKLEKLRTAKKMSYRKFSLEAELSVSYIQKLEAGLSNPSFTTLLKLADALDTDLNEFSVRK